ncbi:MAG: DUF559 domain-containing protein [Candidatus Omnitrophica bacterium]|nr:DUF559 domain-containing protein [Candidatus Omnitrophota bacterium]
MAPWDGVPYYVFELCRELRADSTKAEKVLWECLRRKQLNGFKFRRQHPIGRFIADFYCPACRLVVELDGSIHQDINQKEYDLLRDEIIQTRDIRILRIENERVFDSIEDVLNEILIALENPSP